jgi:hypothetical protein
MATFGREIEPTASDILASLDWHDPMPLDVSRYGTATQERIIAAHAMPVRDATNAMIADLLVEQAEDRAAARYAATLRSIAEWRRVSYEAATCGARECGHPFDAHSVNNPGCGCDLAECGGRTR